MRQALKAGNATVTAFQSTHPLRGATQIGAQHVEQQQISIHAPLAGCDALKLNPYIDQEISIHAPLAGCDLLDYQGGDNGEISIHAPLAGCDSPEKSLPGMSVYFNPRTPCGVRQG